MQWAVAAHTLPFHLTLVMPVIVPLRGAYAVLIFYHNNDLTRAMFYLAARARRMISSPLRRPLDSLGREVARKMIADELI